MKTNSLIRTDLIFPLLLIISSLLLRPSFLGELYSSIGLVLAVISAGFFLLAYKKISLSQHNLLLLILVTSTCFYFLIHTIVVENPNIHIATKTVLGILFSFLAMAIVLSREEFARRFFDLFFYILCFFSLSYILTIIYILAFGINQAIWLTIDYNYFIEMIIFFPLTPVYGIMHSGSIAAPRLAAFAREAGITQAFFVWAFWWGYFTEKGKILLTLAVLGVVFTFSTAGILIFVLSLLVFLGLRKYKKRKIIFLLPAFLLSAFLAIYVVLYAPVTGLVEKQKTHGASINYRENALTGAFDNAMDYPLGVGVNNDFFGSGSGVNLISSMQLIGIVGVVLVLFIFILPKVVYFQKERFILMLPFLVTALLFQPIYDAPLILIFLISTSIKSKDGR